MATAVQHRRGTTALHASFAGKIGEITVDTTKKTAVVHDGATAGGSPLATEAQLAGKADAAALASKADAATAVTLSDSQTLTNKTLTSPVINAPVGAFLRGFLHGMTLSNNVADPANDIDIAIGSASSDGLTPALMTLASALTKRLDAGWAVGTGNGGLDTGSVANTTYHVWLIERSDTGVVDVIFSTSATSPMLPANYDRKRRIGSIVRSGGTIRPFTQRGDEFLWLTPVSDINVNVPGVGTAIRTLSVPGGLQVEAIFSVWLVDLGGSAGQSVNLLLTSPDQADTPASGTIFILSTLVNGSANVSASGLVRIRTNSSSGVRSNLSASGAGVTLRMVTLGYIDTRGR